MKTKSPVPRFFSIRIYLTAMGIFIMLVMPMAVIMLFKYGPYWLEDQQSRDHLQKTTIRHDSLSVPSHSFLEIQFEQEGDEKKVVNVHSEDMEFSQAFGLLMRMMLVSIVLGYAWNYPFRRYFKKKRRLQQPSATLEAFCRKWLLRTAGINTLIVGFGFAVALTFMAFKIFFTNFNSSTTRDFFVQFFIISIIGSILTSIFVYFWFRHRVRFVYLEHVYDNLSLFNPSSKKYGDHIVRRLWINSLMTTLLPLTIVIFYLYLSKTPITEAGAPHLTADQIRVLFGKYLSIIDSETLFQSQQLFYVNAIDSLLMFVGIFSGIMVSIIYLFFFVNWTHQSIVVPLKEVVDKMKQPVDSGLDSLAILRTDDEMGELANGYNEMALRITNNIQTLSHITTANQRFVPVQFLQMLDKESITEVNLGDQVQKWMTILFVDIRSFTTLSEQLTPKENFDFLNAYLQEMEPVIRAHHGFVDKFIGDSIMALFPHRPEDAIEAALEMRRVLEVFNRRLEADGKPAIDTGAGIHTGNLMLGVVGGSGRMETTVISDAVNLASRLEGLTRTYNCPVIVSESAIKALDFSYLYSTHFIDEVYVKGRSGSVKIYTIAEAHVNSANEILPVKMTARVQAVQSFVVNALKDQSAGFSYHNLAHTLDVFLTATKSAIYHSFELEKVELLQTAALMHELGMAEGYQDHEARSAAMARNMLPTMGYNPAEVEQIEALIMATKMPQQPKNFLEEVLCDSDLDYLGRADYPEISQQLRQEWMALDGFPDSEIAWLESQIQFLSGHQYFTEYAQKQRDAIKNQHLDQAIIQLDQLSRKA